MDVARLYRTHGRSVRARIRRFFGEHEADDVLQEVFMKVVDRQAGFRGDSSAATWLYQLTTRHCLDRLRNHRRRQELWLHTQDLAWASPICGSDQESKALLQELWRTLDPELVEIGVYYHLDGMSQPDIAELIAVSRQTVGNRLAALQAQARALGGGK